MWCVRRSVRPHKAGDEHEESTDETFGRVDRKHVAVPDASDGHDAPV